MGTGDWFTHQIKLKRYFQNENTVRRNNKVHEMTILNQKKGHAHVKYKT